MKSIICFIILFINFIGQPSSQGQDANEKEWIGSYHFSAKNRDGMKTSFDIQIIKLNNVTVKYSNDESKPKIYKNIKSKFIQKDKISIAFNPKDKEMGAIYVEKLDDDFFISGSPIYFINPGNDDLPLKKVK
ncbi:hypothetical protein FY557_11775 [Chryseobacterium sp. SN22]|uniref:hypothetical protein n=1 Tax=Chryseobacterium sp. SN22 TaxID=2606431 RepID=UPI0011EC9CF8|nr:hypothetical protein [Chryseobacterium sp. SN22]KAA0127826.1 hypothetical protein FY557_11775 [Chryseobacterium sp. SN22]